MAVAYSRRTALDVLWRSPIPLLASHVKVLEKEHKLLTSSDSRCFSPWGHAGPFRSTNDPTVNLVICWLTRLVDQAGNPARVKGLAGTVIIIIIIML